MAARRKTRREIALDYLVSVVESSQADPARRDAAARELLKQGAPSSAAVGARSAKRPAAAKDPVPPKAEPEGKKQQQLADAATAGKGTPWEGKL